MRQVLLFRLVPDLSPEEQAETGIQTLESAKSYQLQSNVETNSEQNIGQRRRRLLPGKKRKQILCKLA